MNLFCFLTVILLVTKSTRTKSVKNFCYLIYWLINPIYFLINFRWPLSTFYSLRQGESSSLYLVCQILIGWHFRFTKRTKDKHELYDKYKKCRSITQYMIKYFLNSLSIYILPWIPCLLPKTFDNFFSLRVSSKHNYNTRLASKSTYYINSIRTNYGKYNLHFCGTSIWNKLNKELRNLSLLPFEQTMTKRFLSVYVQSWLSIMLS